MINIPPSQSLERDEQPHKSKNATAIQSLSCEHRHIETVIKSLHDAVAALNARQRLNVQKDMDELNKAHAAAATVPKH